MLRFAEIFFLIFQATEAIQNKCAFIILSDRLADKDFVPVRYVELILSVLSETFALKLL